MSTTKLFRVFSVCASLHACIYADVYTPLALCSPTAGDVRAPVAAQPAAPTPGG